MTPLQRVSAALRALRDFLAGFTGMPSARLHPPCAPECDTSSAARAALTARAERRPSCC